MIQQARIIYVPFRFLDAGGWDEDPGWGAFVWDGKELGEQIFASRGKRAYTERWLIENGYLGSADGIYRKKVEVAS